MYDISKLASWVGGNPDLRQIDVWKALFFDFGDALLRFLIDETYVGQIPDDDRFLLFKQTLREVPDRLLETYPGAAWVLMAHKGLYADLPPPFARKGFLLPLAWKKSGPFDGGGHSALLPSDLLKLAERVKRQFAANGIAADGYYLHPWDGFDGGVDFSRMDATFGSAWGALATGLYNAVAEGAERQGPVRRSAGAFSRILRRKADAAARPNWPFSSIDFEFTSEGEGNPAEVTHLAEKLAVVARYGGRELAVAPCQLTLLEGELERFEKESGVKIRPFAWKWRKDDFRSSVRSLAQCNQPRTAKKVVYGVLLAGCVLGMTAFGVLSAQQHAARQDVERERVVAQAAPFLTQTTGDSAFGTLASGLMQLSDYVDNESVRELVVNQLRLRSWLVPVGEETAPGLLHERPTLEDVLSRADDAIAAAEAVLADKDGSLARRLEPAPVSVPKDWPIEYRSTAGVLSAVRKDTGEELWKSPMGFQVLSGMVNATNGLLLAQSYAPEHAVIGMDAVQGTVVWSRQTGTMLKQWSISPNGKYWALLSQDRQVSVLGTGDGRCAFETVRVGPEVLSLAFSGDSSRLYLRGGTRTVVCQLCPSQTFVQLERPGDLLLDWRLTDDGMGVEQDVQFTVSEKQLAELAARFARGESVSPNELTSRSERQIYDLKSLRVVSTCQLSEASPPLTPSNEKLAFQPPSLSERWKRIPSGGWAFGTRLMRQVHVCDEAGRKLWSSVGYSTPGVIPFDVDPSGQLLAVAVANDEVQLFDVRSGAERSARWKQDGGISGILFADLAGEPLLLVCGGRDDPIEDGPGFLSVYDTRLGIKCFEISGTRYRIKRCAVDAGKNILFDDGSCRAVNAFRQPKGPTALTAEEVRTLLQVLTNLSWDEPSSARHRELFKRVGIGDIPGR